MDGQRLRDLRIQRGHTLESLSELIGVNGQQIWRWEARRNEPLSHMIAALARALETTTDYLLGLTDDPSPRPYGELTPLERELLAALRRGDTIGAVKLILQE